MCPPRAAARPAALARLLALTRLAALVGLAAACTRGTPATPGPAVAVRAEITQAETAEKARRHDLARAHYLRAIDAAHDPESVAFARHEYAETLVTWGEAPEARAQLELAAAKSPADPSVWHDLGILRHNAGDDPGAIQALARAEQLAPDDPRPRTALAALYWKRGDKAGAAREYRGMLALDLPERLRAKVEWALAELAKP
jgi:Flp pilus assembly protein TadD